MDKTLEAWAAEGVRTPEDVRKRQQDRAGQAQGTRKAAAKSVSAQQYEQRNYDNEQGEALQRMISAMHSSDKGGEENA